MRGNTLSSQQSSHQSRGESSSGRRRKNADDREQRQHRRTTTSSPAASAKGPVVRESGSTATAGAAAQQQTRPRRNLHCLPRQTDANNNNRIDLQHVTCIKRKHVVSVKSTTWMLLGHLKEIDVCLVLM